MADGGPSSATCSRSHRKEDASKRASFELWICKENMDEVDISEQSLLEKCPAVLHALLKDNARTEYALEKSKRDETKITTPFQENIIWGTSNYLQYGDGFRETDPIIEKNITGENKWLVRPRAVKDREIQRQRSKDMAEVFTPSWVCNAQNNLIDEAWFGKSNVFNTEFVDKEGVHRWTPTDGVIKFAEDPSRTSTKSWKEYVKDIRLEITCGEAPYLVSRYDTVTGQPITDLNQRIGILDRKLRVVSENVKKERDWCRWASEALKSIYGFEWQGDNLLLAREAILFTVVDYYRAKFKREPKLDLLKDCAYIISWNVWQMDGLKMVIPYSCHEEEEAQMDFFGEAKKRECPACAKGARTGHNGIKCIIRDWMKKGGSQIVAFEDLFEGGR